MNKTTASYTVTLVLITGLVSKYENDTIIYPLVREAMVALITYLEFREEDIELTSDLPKFINNICSRETKSMELQINANKVVNTLMLELTNRGIVVEGNQILRS